MNFDVPFYFFRSSLYNIPYMYMKPVLTAEQADKINKQTIYSCPIFMNKVCTLLYSRLILFTWKIMQKSMDVSLCFFWFKSGPYYENNR